MSDLEWLGHMVVAVLALSIFFVLMVGFYLLFDIARDEWRNRSASKRPKVQHPWHVTLTQYQFEQEVFAAMVQQGVFDNGRRVAPVHVHPLAYLRMRDFRNWHDGALHIGRYRIVPYADKHADTWEVR